MGQAGDPADLYQQAVQVVLRDKKASTSYIQRRLPRTARATRFDRFVSRARETVELNDRTVDLLYDLDEAMKILDINQ